MPLRPRETNRLDFARAEEDKAISRLRAGLLTPMARASFRRSRKDSLHHPIVLLADAKEDERPCENFACQAPLIVCLQQRNSTADCADDTDNWGRGRASPKQTRMTRRGNDQDRRLRFCVFPLAPIRVIRVIRG